VDRFDDLDLVGLDRANLGRRAVGHRGRGAGGGR
jgi:hypothetical protein